MQGYILVFKPIIDQILRRYSFGKQLPHLFYHSLMKACFQPAAYLVTPHLTVNLQTEDGAFKRRISCFGLIQKRPVVGNLDGTYGSFLCVGIGVVVQGP